MGKYLLVTAHIAKLNELTETEVTEMTSSMVDETSLAILKKQESREIIIVSLQRQIRFDIQFDPYWLQWQTKHSKLAHKNLGNPEFHQYTWNRYLTLGFVSAHIPWNTISNLLLWRWYKALRDDLLLMSATTLTNIYCREYALTVEAIKKQLPSRNKVSLALARLRSTHELPITWVIAYCMDRNLALCEVQLALDDVDSLFLSRFKL